MGEKDLQETNLTYHSRGRIAGVKNTATLPEADVCKLEKQAGPCRSMRPRFFYNQDSGECEVIYLIQLTNKIFIYIFIQVLKTFLLKTKVNTTRSFLNELEEFFTKKIKKEFY